jgi:hypothetical protein
MVSLIQIGIMKKVRWKGLETSLHQKFKSPPESWAFGGVLVYIYLSQCRDFFKNSTTFALTAALTRSWSGLNLDHNQLLSVTLLTFEHVVLSGLLRAPYKLFFPHSKLFFPSKSSTNPWCWDFHRVDEMLIRLTRELLCGAKSPGSHTFLTPATLFLFVTSTFILVHATQIYLRVWFEANSVAYTCVVSLSLRSLACTKLVACMRICMACM